MKTLRRFLIAVAAAVAALWLAVGLMRSPFVIESGVVNDTTSTLEAVPLVLADNMPIVLVPRYSSEPLRIYSLLRDDTPLVVPPNASARLLYDYDDLNLCWLMVRAQGTSQWKFVPSRLAATPSCAPPPELNHPCCAAVTDAFVVRELDALEDAPTWMTEALLRE